MPNLQEVQSQFAKFADANNLGESKEAEQLPKLLGDDERVLAAVRGVMDGLTWMLVCTDGRLLLLEETAARNPIVREFPLKRLSSIQYYIGLAHGEIAFTVGVVRTQMKNVEKKHAAWFVGMVRRTCNELTHNRSVGTKIGPEGDLAGPVMDDVIGKLERLGALRDKGLLTDDEYTRHKWRLLGDS
ncbi:PH domain-containing protein [Lysobacter sp. LF1]|uniref:PH domain-containing protein n=1 Tax=Lysobacter stagni TaxID=3045172 RepID=A0ABT6XI89_9GAMM|nr:PH domain-containing protein [Lysobacter sp. LF1]MDI9239876.1 PH domain-containing protein [Lysobacter sp. LF1]